MKTTTAALVLLIVAAGLWRVTPTLYPELYNIAPISALAFCAAAFRGDRRLWLVPFVALFLSDLLLDAYHATQTGLVWTWRESLLRAVAICPALAFGVWSRAWSTRFAWVLGSLAGSAVFYLITNSAAWWLDPFYVKSTGGWWQALTIGHPEFPPTWWFFRNTLLGDLAFTGLCWFAFRQRSGLESAASGDAAASRS